MRKTALVVVLLVILAGCNGQSGAPSTPENPQTTVTTTAATTQSPTPTTSSDPVVPVNVTEQNASLGDVNATKVWQRVGQMVDVDAEPPPVVVKSRSREITHQAKDFERSFGAETVTYNDTLPSGHIDVGLNPQITIWRPPGATDVQTEIVLAHEFIHAHQTYVYGLGDEQEDLAVLTLEEGITEALAWRYAEQYAEHDAEELLAERFADTPPIVRDGLSQYYIGAQYARNYTDPDAPFESMQENAPTTAEQVLHGLEPGSEQPLNLAVHGSAGDDGAYMSPLFETKGEDKLRFLLEYGLSRERAAAAAEGWGNDRLAPYQSRDGDGWAWVIRWDSPSEADEFETAFADFEVNVSEPLAVRTVGEETTVVFSGSEGFVRNATVSGIATNVTVSV